LLCLTAILTNSNHQHNGMEGTKLSLLVSQFYFQINRNKQQLMKGVESGRRL